MATLEESEASASKRSGGFLVHGIVLIVLFALVGCDQITKSIAERELTDREPVELLSGMVRFTLAENPGTFMGLGSGLDDAARWAIYLGSFTIALVSLILLFVYAKRLGRVRTVGVLLFLSGALGNLVDRFTNHGCVIDFVVLAIGPLHTGVFNVADVFIICGIGLLVLGAGKQQWDATSAND
jgi:signal peptidase II